MRFVKIKTIKRRKALFRRPFLSKMVVSDYHMIFMSRQVTVPKKSDLTIFLP